jgi:hypothetical protein
LPDTTAESIDVPITCFLESAFKWLFLGSLVLLGVSYWQKDDLPAPETFDRSRLEAPIQTPTDREPFTVRVRDQEYRIEPKAEFALDGVVVSYSNADAIKNIWHHKSWKDFLNLRDLCVVWGENVTSGVYRDMRFRNDSWTCWASWSDPAVTARFKMNALSNNHLLTDDRAIKDALMSAEPGDQIRFKGVLVEYVNVGNGYARGTSLTRDDTGNGACETVYLDEFEVLHKANLSARRLFGFAAWTALFTGIGFLIMLPIAPVRVRRRI